MVQATEVNKLFYYEDGQLYWKPNPDYSKSWNTRHANKVAGSKRSDGYIVVQFKISGQRVVEKAHRLIWVIHYGELPKLDLDHIDRNPSNNRIENLRDVTHQVNSFNRGANKNCKSGVKGVAWHKKNKRWTAHISIDKRKFYLGSFNTIEEAANTRHLAEKELLSDL